MVILTTLKNKITNEILTTVYTYNVVPPSYKLV